MTGPHLTTTTALLRELCAAIKRMSFSEKAAFRFALSMKYPELRKRIVN